MAEVLCEGANIGAGAAWLPYRKNARAAHSLTDASPLDVSSHAKYTAHAHACSAPCNYSKNTILPISISLFYIITYNNYKVI